MEASIEEKLRAGFTDVKYLKIVDLSDGCGAKIEITLVADEFEGKPLLQCHRMVHKAIVEERKTIHALTLKTIPPSKWVPGESA